MTFEEKISEIIQNYNLGNFLKAGNLAKSLLIRNVNNYQLCNIYALILVKLNKKKEQSVIFKNPFISSQTFLKHNITY